MERIIPPVPRELLVRELCEGLRLRNTNKNHNQIYVVTYQTAPNVVREIGRLREIAFRVAGGGSGKACDLDEFDTADNPYRQLIVWDPETEQILGGYRFFRGDKVSFTHMGQPQLATSHLFYFSDKFINDYLPQTIELGRSFVTLQYQATRQNSVHSLYTLDNLWDGLGALSVIMPEVKYFFGKMTMYPSFDRLGRDMILFFLHKYFGDKDGLVVPVNPVRILTDKNYLRALFVGADFREDYRILNREVRRLGFNIPPLVNAYMQLSPTMRTFGTGINDLFGNVEETGILIAIDEILEEKRMRHIDTYIREHPESYTLLKDILNLSK